MLVVPAVTDINFLKYTVVLNLFKYSKSVMATNAGGTVTLLAREQGWPLPPVVMDERVQEHIESVFDQVGLR